MNCSSDKTIVGFIGTGVMGRSMAANLMKDGYRLLVYNRTKSSASDLLANGAEWKNDAAEVAAGSDVVITIVGFPDDVREVYLGERGIIAHARPGTLLIDMTTSRPDLAVEIAEKAHAAGMQALDAPVSGGDSGARDGRLSIMVGGQKGAFEDATPLFRIMGENIVHQGPPGSGQHCKMCNQIALASTMVGVSEAIAYARASGLDPETVLKSIANGAAGSWALSNLGPKMIARDQKPGFYVKHFIKDMKIAVDSAKALGLEVPGLSGVLSLYEKLAARGGDMFGTQALYSLYDQQQKE